MTAAQTVGTKMRNTNNIRPNKGHSKAEMEHWDTVMSEHLGEDMSYNQPYELRGEIHTGRLKITSAWTSSSSETTSC